MASYDSECNEYRVWIPKNRKMGDHHFFGPIRVTCERCKTSHTIPAQLTEPYLCSRDRLQLARPLDKGDGRDGILVHLPSVENELFCTNAKMQCQSGTCTQWVDLNVLRDTGMGMSFEAGYPSLPKSKDQVN